MKIVGCNTPLIANPVAAVYCRGSKLPMEALEFSRSTALCTSQKQPAAILRGNPESLPPALPLRFRTASSAQKAIL